MTQSTAPDRRKATNVKPEVMYVCDLHPRVDEQLRLPDRGKAMTPACPSWCKTDHGVEQAQMNPTHMSSLLDAADDEGHAQVQLVYVEGPNPRPKDDYGVFVEVSQDRALSPAEARKLAQIIIDAADEIEEVFPE